MKLAGVRDYAGDVLPGGNVDAGQAEAVPLSWLATIVPLRVIGLPCSPLALFPLIVLYSITTALGPRWESFWIPLAAPTSMERRSGGHATPRRRR